MNKNIKGNNFYRIGNKNLIESTRKNSLINSFKALDNLHCILACSNNLLCTTAVVDSSICSIFNKVQITDSNTIYSPTATIFVKNGYNQANNYLIHYWPFNGNYMNVITKDYLFNGISNSLVKDRFGRPSSSLYLVSGCMRAPDDYYIYGDFTLTVWVKMFSAGRLFRAYRPNYPSIIFTYHVGPYYHYYSDQYSNTSLTPGKWQHLAFTIKQTTLSIYIDGLVQYNGTTNIIIRQLDTLVFIGGDGINRANAEFDDIKIFSKSLSQTEIIQSSLENL